MRSKLKRSKVCTDAGRTKANQEQTNEVTEISSETESSCSDPTTVLNNSVSLCVNNESNCSYSAPDKDGSHTKDSSDKLLTDLDSCFREVQISNPTFPVNSVFSFLCRKGCQKGHSFTSNYEEQDHSKGNSSQDSHQRSREDTAETHPPAHVLHSSTPAKPVRTNRLSRTRKLKHESARLETIEPENKRTRETKADQRHHREPFSEVALWTDKYSPGHSSEIIGNRSAVEKLHSWLKKWKLKTDGEDMKTHEEMQNEGKNNDSWDCGDFEDEVRAEDRTEEYLCNTVLISGPPGVGKTASVYACAVELGFKVFEVNCSSQRNGREVLAQLKEATQSHLVEISGKDPLKPAFFNSYNIARDSPRFNPLPVRTPKKAKVSTSKKKPAQIKSKCKERAKPITLTSYFKTKAKADYLYCSGQSPSKKSSKHSKSTDRSESDDQSGTSNKHITTSLILFEEVDVIFQDDVGFLAAIKTFMATTKRPVILTSSDPLFRHRFNSCLDEIIYKTPSMADVCSYLRLVCLAEKVQVCPDDVKTLFTVTRGDVRRSLLQLQLWAQSGAGHGSHTINEADFCYKGCSANMLGLQSVTEKNLSKFLQLDSWTELQKTDLLLPMTESWRNYFPLLYSNLELLLHLNSNKQDNKFSDSEQHIGTACGVAVETKSKLSKKKNTHSMPQTQMSQKRHCSTDKLKRTDSLTALSNFFDIVSFIDAQQVVSAPCNREEFIWTGARIQDGQLDEMREEEENKSNLEVMLDIGATLEALGCHQCWKLVSSCEAQRSKGNTLNIKTLNYITQRLDPVDVSERFNLSKNVLCSRFFSSLHNRRAVCTDYLPVVRFICRTHRKRKKRTEHLTRYVKAFRKQLGLTKESVQLLAGDFS